jgi:hypothetical protein
MKHEAPAEHPRPVALQRLVARLNLWVMAPDDSHRTKALRAALRTYQQAVKKGEYPPLDRNCCERSEACEIPPTEPPSTFEHFFGSAKPSPQPRAGGPLPWED